MRACPHCSRPQGTDAYRLPPQLVAAARGREVIYLWAVCPCELEREADQGAHLRAAAALADQSAAAAALDYNGLRGIQHLQLRTFHPGRLRSDPDGNHPYDFAMLWLEKVVQLERAAEGAASTLWFHSPPGRGKTHLAAGIALDVQAEGRPVVFLSARTWMARYWAAPFEDRPRLMSHAAERAHLLCIDDLGYGEASPAAVGLWDTLIDLRYIRRGWTVITSQETPEQLRDRGYLTDAAYSRLRGMTRGAVLAFDGEDYRL